MSGRDIARSLRSSGVFDEITTKSFISQILQGLEYLHSHGIVHGNLNCSNILFDPVIGTCEISGFSLVRRIEERDTSSDSLMSDAVFWMAPELVDPAQNGIPNVKSDIWSLGCVALELWSTRVPWQGQDAEAVKLQV